MARPRKPTAILELSGAFRKNPQRRAAREGEPTPAGEVGPPDGNLPGPVAACWREIVAGAAPGVLTTSDRIAVRSAARLMVLEAKGKIRTGERVLLHRLLSDFGMTPRGRCYVKAPAPTDGPNEFEAV